MKFTSYQTMFYHLQTKHRSTSIADRAPQIRIQTSLKSSAGWTSISAICLWAGRITVIYNMRTPIRMWDTITRYMTCEVVYPGMTLLSWQTRYRPKEQMRSLRRFKGELHRRRSRGHAHLIVPSLQIRVQIWQLKRSTLEWARETRR